MKVRKSPVPWCCGAFADKYMIVFAKEIKSNFDRVAVLMNSIGKTLLSEKSASVGVFIFAIFLRGISEVQTSPYPSGYDTTSGYIIEILNPLLVGRTTLLSATLLDNILWLTHYFTQIDPFLELRLISPFLYGIFAMCFYFMERRYLKLSSGKSFLIVVALILQPAILRLGWDLLREEFALSLFFVLVGLTRGRLIPTDRPKTVLTLSLVIAFTEQLISVLLLVVVLSQFLWSVKKRELQVEDIWPIIPFFFLICIQVSHFAGLNFIPSAPLISVQGGSGPGEIVTTGNLSNYSPFVDYFLSDPRFLYGNFATILAYVGSLSTYSVIPLIPFAVLGFYRDQVLRPLTLWLSVAGYSLIFSPFLALNFYWRWILLLPIPLTIYAARGLEKFNLRTHSNLPKIPALIFLMSLLLLGLSYSTTTSAQINQQAYTYLPRGLPETAFPLGDSQSIISLVSYVDTTPLTQHYMITSEDFAGLAATSLGRGSTLIILDPKTTTEEIAAQCYNLNASHAYVLWYSDLNVSQHELFLVRQQGNVAIYQC
jgi:hypothetical protein